jgi:hypothetical protein
MRACPGCREELDERFRFCPWCGAQQRLKLVEFFPAHPCVEGDRGKALRVSRYLDDDLLRHVRFSVWSDRGRTARADAAVSLAEDESARLARFLSDPASVASPDAGALGGQ